MIPPLLLQGSAGGAGGTELRLVDTDAFTQSPKPTQGSVTVLPRSVELLSYPQYSDAQHAVVLSMMGSRWSAPLALPGPRGGPAGAGASAQQQQQQQGSSAAAIAARCAGAARGAGGVKGAECVLM